MTVRPRVLLPGVPVLPPGTERYRVKGGGSVVLRLNGGDRITIQDLEGRQPGEVLALRSGGLADPGLLGTTGRSSGENQAAIADALRTHGLAIDGISSIPLFAPESRPGEAAAFTAADEATVMVVALGRPMTVDAQTPPTDLEVTIERAQVPDKADPRLPDPLADPSIDLHIDRATARAYTVKAGEFIQVIDLEGRQCSDLQVFPAEQLERGIERCIDATTTRTVMGVGYPMPGLRSKFFDQDMQPLVEVVQDTCGRHDFFGLACSAKYYDDRGYPGHANCSDNFNGALDPYGVAPRRGWMAINFFYNTGIDELNQFYLDNSWSRPGDYVLLRALTDLVCVSSSCPDDIDPANAWVPTDIHVRVYPKENVFKTAIGFRMTTDSDPDLTKETGFHGRTAKLTRDFSEYRGYWLPNHFNNHGAIEEYWACREKAVVMDLSPLRKFEVVGPDAEALCQYVFTRNIRRLSVGQVVYTAMCQETGGMIDDGTLLRLGPDNFRWIGGDDYGGIWMRQQAEKLGLQVWVKSSTDQLHNIAVQGPKSRDILKGVIWTPPNQPSLEELQWFRFAIGRIGDFDGSPVIVSRTGYTGELGFEIFCHPNDASGVWDAVWEAGRPHGLTPFGLEALDMVRIEAGLVFAGHEFDDQTDPFEAGIGFTVPLKSKEDDFIGRAALLERKAHPQRVLVGLELMGDEVAAHGDCVHIGKPQVGIVTSGTRSPILKKNIALCRMAVEHAEPGTEVEVGKLDGHQKRLPATVVRSPFYDPDKSRVRA